MALRNVQDLLKKQKLVEGMVHHQTMQQHDLVEGMVHRQHLAELRRLLGTLSPTELAHILESLDLGDARMVWAEVEQDRQDDILWSIADPVRRLLVGDREPRFSRGRVNAFELVDSQMRVVSLKDRADLKGLQPLWIDLLNASLPERRGIGQHFGLELPDPDDLTDLAASARFYLEDGGELHLHSNFLFDREPESQSVPVAFILRDRVLFTVRNFDLPVFRLQRLRARAPTNEVASCMDVLLELYGADVEYSADALEDIYATLRRVGKEVLAESLTDKEAARILGEIAEQEDLNDRIRGSLLDKQRALSFLLRGRLLTESQIEDAKEILRDIDSLNSHTAFLFGKINFLMDATVGFININQNHRVSQLTVVSIVFMPLNFLAGVGGMSEYSMMTEGLRWPLAYGAFLGGMIFVGWLTFVGLKFFEARRLNGEIVNRRRQ